MARPIYVRFNRSSKYFKIYASRSVDFLVSVSEADMRRATGIRGADYAEMRRVHVSVEEAKGKDCVWLGRPLCIDSYEVGTSKSDWDAGKGFPLGGGFLAAFCKHHWEKRVGFKLEPGEIKRVRIRLEDAPLTR